MNELAKSVLAPLVSALLTPLTVGLAVWVAWLLRDRLRAVIASLLVTSVEIKGNSVRLYFDAPKVAEAYRKQGMGNPSAEDVEEVARLERSLSSFVAGRRILWVDNQPEGNRLERDALVNWKVEVQTRRTTENALEELRLGKESFDLVISDWFRGGRPEGPSLVKAMRGQGICTPVLFYFFAPDTDLFRSIVAEAKDLQAVGATSSPRELLLWTFAELVRASLRDRRTRLGSGEDVQV